MVKDFLGRGAAHTRDSAAEQSSTFPDQNSTSIPDSPKSSFSSTDGYLTLHDLARLRVDREAALPSTQKLNSLHEQIALGESALTWILFSTPPTCASSACSEKHPACISAPRIPLLPLAQFFGAERLPDGWWTSMRPKSSVGLLQARKCAAIVGKEMEEIRRAESTESDCQVGAA